MTDGFHSKDGGWTAVSECCGVENIQSTVWPRAGEDGASFARRLVDMLSKNGGSLVKCDVFGSCAAYAAFMRECVAAFPPQGFPVTWVEGAGCDGQPLAGATIRGVVGASVETITVEGRPAGRLYEDAACRYCLLGGIHTTATAIMPDRQTHQTLELLEAGLNAAGMDMTNIVRTWFYNDRLLEWYDSFNETRTRFYGGRGIFDKVLPASTGIGGRNPHDSALVAAAEAIAFKHRDASVKTVTSPLQNHALRYGSAFSRAVEITMPRQRRLLVSGTASISEEGKTVYEGDIAGQIRQTLKVVDALLVSRRMSWENVVRAIAYVKRPGYALDFSRYLASSGIPALPWIMTHSEVCRDNLLFEIEVDAVMSANE